MKKRKFLKNGLILLAFIGVFTLFSFQSKFFEIAKQIEIYNTLFKELNMYYVDEINPAEITNKAIKNTLKDLDPYTNFYTEQEVEDAKINRAGAYAGIGVSVNFMSLGIEINEVFKGFSADKAGLHAGDIITFINGQFLKGMDKNTQSNLLKGAVNSKFTIKVNRQGNLIEKELIREKVVVNPVSFSKMIDEKTGYIALTVFNSKASSEVKKAFVNLKKQGMQNLVLDLRSNPGGSLLESINIANFFLPKDKTIVTTKAKVKKWSNTYKTKNKPLDLEMPLVVLVNERSASASEIVSGSLQDYDRAIILGKRTFGKGLVQRYRPLQYGTQLKLTVSKYYTPSGRCIQELDYANRKENGKIPKFSDNGVNTFKTANGRTVYDGGGVLPDVVIDSSTKTMATKKLLLSRAIFNYCTYYFYNSDKIENVNSYKFNDSNFNEFLDFLKTDTTFVTPQEKLFKKAFSISKNNNISEEYKTIRKKLFQEKINEISKDSEVLKEIIKEGVLERYFYKEGVYQHNLKNDFAIKKALELLKNKTNYNKILSIK